MEVHERVEEWARDVLARDTSLDVLGDAKGKYKIMETGGGRTRQYEDRYGRYYQLYSLFT